MIEEHQHVLSKELDGSLSSSLISSILYSSPYWAAVRIRGMNNQHGPCLDITLEAAAFLTVEGQDSRNALLWLYNEMTKEEVHRLAPSVPGTTVGKYTGQKIGRFDHRGYSIFSQHVACKEKSEERKEIPTQFEEKLRLGKQRPKKTRCT